MCSLLKKINVVKYAHLKYPAHNVMCFHNIIFSARYLQNMPLALETIIIKRVLLAVAQSRSLHVVHEAYFWESEMQSTNILTYSCHRDQERVQPEDDDQDEE